MTDTQSSTELLPCPWCAERPRLDQRQTQSLWSRNEVTFSLVICDECEVSGKDFCDDPDGEEAIKWWNSRAQPAEQQDERARAVTRYDRDSVSGHSDVEVALPEHKILHYDHGPNLAEALARLAHRVAKFHGLPAPSLASHAALAVMLPDVDQLSNIIRQVDGNHSLGAGALAEKIVEAVAGLNDYGRHGDEDMMVEE